MFKLVISLAWKIIDEPRPAVCSKQIRKLNLPPEKHNVNWWAGSDWDQGHQDLLTLKSKLGVFVQPIVTFNEIKRSSSFKSAARPHEPRVQKINILRSHCRGGRASADAK